MAHDALAAHVRDELGITETLRARPVQAALASAASFALGAALPIATSLAVSADAPVWITVTTVVALLGLGGLAAYAGGAPALRGAVRVAFWGALAMALAAGVGRLFGTTV
jgi:VIT1/CCC1 family predicted Fe2+/Mn2+ transporter